MQQMLQMNVVFLTQKAMVEWHMCETKLYGFIHYNVQYVMFKAQM
jgi:hypothetical protein